MCGPSLTPEALLPLCEQLVREPGDPCGTECFAHPSMGCGGAGAEGAKDDCIVPHLDGEFGAGGESERAAGARGEDDTSISVEAGLFCHIRNI